MASRAIVLLAAFAAERLMVRNPALTSGEQAPLLRSLTSWDGWFYLGIVREGYHAAPVAGVYHDFAFLPLYPLLVRVLSWPWPEQAGLVAVLLSNVAFLVAMVLLYELGRTRMPAHRAARAATLMAIFPFGFVFAMAYTESLFLALTVGSFLAAERDRRVLAGLLLGLACLTRIQGIVLVIPLAWLWLSRDGWRPRPNLVTLGLAPLAVVGFFAYTTSLTGDPRAFFTAQVAWGRAGPGTSGSVEAGTNLAAGLSPYLMALLVILCLSVFLLVYVRPDGLGMAYGCIPVLYLGMAFASGSLEAIGRIAMVAFPYAWILANRRNGLFRAGWPLLSAGLLGLFALLAFGGYWVP
ncbi:MAG TPA: mannosyltransferase family protein [Candidatus Limnocylindrales bacterium]|nr:mannosyltransferase family protein [Candidatus Limnocylindrales bacterium]